jgi:hypothetical protein
MKGRFEEIDLSRVTPVPIAGRRSKVAVGDIVDPRRLQTAPGAGFEDALPDILAARSLKRVASALHEAREADRERVWMIGAHTIKCGLSGYLAALIEEGYITCLASTGSAVIHDLELAFFGQTSEDVGAELSAGRFGMSAETAAHFEAACARADELGVGLGAGVGAYVDTAGAQHAGASVYRAAYLQDVPTTVHVAFGTDITHQHPGFPAARVGEQTMRDFRVFAHRVGRAFDGGVVVLMGSAVVLPEVFLKAVSINYNLGRQPSGVVAASFDMLPQYRVRENVLGRPFQSGGEAHAITGHHEIMLPLLYGLLRARSPR